VRYVLGIDAGGTKTVGLLATEEGEILSEARGGGANLQAAGELGVEKVLHDVMEQAIGHRSIWPAAICLGIAGVDRDEDLAVVRAVMRRIGYKTDTLVVNDALVALVAGAGSAPGIVVIAGTGSIAYGRSADNRAARAGGWGYILGDEGSGYWIGRRALRAVVRHADGRGTATLLTRRLLDHFGIARAQDLITVVYARKLPPPSIASLAKQVFEAARDGDGVAQAILADAASELEVSAASVMRRLGMADDEFTFVLAGGIFRAVPSLTVDLQSRLARMAPSSHVVVLDAEPAVGAVVLAIEQMRGGANLPVYV
jgi:N-acetylglucosamine kinase-like BadF-type ATPase